MQLSELAKEYIERERMPPHTFNNFELQRYYQNEPQFNGVSSRNNLPKIKDGTYVINLEECKSIETHWVAINNKLI